MGDDQIEQYVSDQLRALTRAIDEAGHEVIHGFLGGTYGYGAHFSNGVFEMRPFFWDDCDCGHDEVAEEWCDTHPHASECYRTDLGRLQGVPTDEEYRSLCRKHGIEWNDGLGCAVHCTCGRDEAFTDWRTEHDHAPTCTPYLPNFKCGAFEVRWYKYIGRDMEITRGGLSDEEIARMFARCLGSILPMVDAHGEDATP